MDSRKSRPADRLSKALLPGDAQETGRPAASAAFDCTRLSPFAVVPPIGVAEIGTAHGGNLSRGLELVDAAAEGGADIVKVQVVFAGEILPPEAGLVPLPGGPTPLYQVFKSLEQPPDFYASLAARADERGIGFLATPFGERSITLLEGIGVQAWKVASPELNHEPLLERLAATGLPIVLSTGVSQTEDIERALNTVARVSGNPPPVLLLHCLTAYPAPEEEANLRVIPAMAAAHHCLAGLSDHSLHPILLPSLAVALGAVMVEKHLTLNRDGDGLDDKVALCPHDFARMMSAMRHFAPLGLSAAVEELSKEYGAARVDAALGNGIKTLAPSEQAHYGRTNRSLHAVGALCSGTVVTEANTALLRTEKVLKPGVPPHRRSEIYGRRLSRDVASGDGISWDDVE